MVNSKLLEIAKDWKNDEIFSKSKNIESVSAPETAKVPLEQDSEDSPEIFGLRLKLKRWNYLLEITNRSNQYTDELWGKALPEKYPPKNRILI